MFLSQKSFEPAGIFCDQLEHSNFADEVTIVSTKRYFPVPTALKLPSGDLGWKWKEHVFLFWEGGFPSNAESLICDMCMMFFLAIPINSMLQRVVCFPVSVEFSFGISPFSTRCL